MKLAVAYSTDVGRVRDGNEDSLLVDEHLGLFAVADGMGGHQGGEVASSTAIEALRAAVAAGQRVDLAIVSANGAVLKRASGDPRLTGMGTTLTAMHPLGGSRLLIGHVGDSRAYLLRRGNLERLTEDHSLVEELVREGRITREQADVHPQRNIVTRALGMEHVDVDVLPIEVETGDRLLICSDGLTTMVREREVARLLGGDDDVQHIADRLVDEAVKNGGEDNVTVVVIDVLDATATPSDADETTAMPPAVAETEQQAAADDTGQLAVAPDAVEAHIDDDAELQAPSPSPGFAPRRVGRFTRWLRRGVLAMLPVIVVLVVTAFALHWAAYRSFYVGTSADRVAIYHGEPGGILWWKPHLVRSYELVATLPAVAQPRVLSSDGTCKHSSWRAVRVCLDALLTSTS